MININPFPLPAEVLESVAQEAMCLMLPENIQQPRPGTHHQEPAFIDAFEEWHVQTGGSTQGLLNVALELPSLRDVQAPYQDIQWDLLINGIEALDFRLKQFGALLWWAKATWRYDPAIRSAADSQPDTEERSFPEGACKEREAS
jgi:hypothetical protein